MALVQIDEAELLAHRSVVASVNGMLANKDSRALLLQSQKLANPNAIIPELDAQAPLQAEIAEMRAWRKEQESLAAADRAERAQEAQIAKFEKGWEQQKSSLRAEGWRDEGIAAIEAHAQKIGVADLSIAAAHWEKLNPPAEPAQPNGSGSWGFFDNQSGNDDFVEKMIASRGEDEAALNAEIRATLADVRGSSGLRR